MADITLILIFMMAQEVIPVEMEGAVSKKPCRF
jgi:hypothetical protein